jgi:hypothetical protein
MLHRRGQRLSFSTLVMLLSALGMMALLSGCWTKSIHPIYSDDTLVFDERLIGSFEDDEGIWTVSRDGSDAYSNSYRAVHVDEDGLVSEFEAHLAEINDALILDVFPEDWPDEASEMVGQFVVPVHWFFRVDAMDDVLILAAMDSEWLEDHLKAFPETIGHFFVDDVVVLTAETERLQAFVGAHVRNADAWSDPVEYERLPVSERQ